MLCAEHHPIRLYTDHSSFTIILQTAESKDRIRHWHLAPSEYDLDSGAHLLRGWAKLIADILLETKSTVDFGHHILYPFLQNFVAIVRVRIRWLRGQCC